MAAAKQFFRQTKEATGCTPERVTAIGTTSTHELFARCWGRKVEHRTKRYLNTRMEQNHRGVKQRYYPMRGFGNFEAARFCRAYEEQRNYFRARTRPNETVRLAEQRQLFRQRLGALQERMIAA